MNGNRLGRVWGYDGRGRWESRAFKRFLVRIVGVVAVVAVLAPLVVDIRRWVNRVSYFAPLHEQISAPLDQWWGVDVVTQPIWAQFVDFFTTRLLSAPVLATVGIALALGLTYRTFAVAR